MYGGRFGGASRNLISLDSARPPLTGQPTYLATAGSAERKKKKETRRMVVMQRQRRGAGI